MEQDQYLWKDSNNNNKSFIIKKLLKIEKFSFQNKSAPTMNEISNTNIPLLKSFISYNKRFKNASLSYDLAKPKDSSLKNRSKYQI